MGLAGRRVKQRIGPDPRNLAWSDNAARFGHEYLSKFGWSPSTGLGATGEGRTSNITVAQKLDLLGIGASRGADDIAWKQNRDFEGMLARLNQAETASTPVETSEAGGDVQGFREEVVGDETVAKKDRKKRNRDKQDESTEATVKPPRRMAHRSRFLASKRLVNSSAVALSEILGIPVGQATSTTTTPDQEDCIDTQIKSANQNVGDYFKEKMKAKLAARQQSRTPNTPEIETSDITPDKKKRKREQTVDGDDGTSSVKKRRKGEEA